jgi:hypothetical protein
MAGSGFGSYDNSQVNIDAIELDLRKETCFGLAEICSEGPVMTDVSFANTKVNATNTIVFEIKSIVFVTKTIVIEANTIAFGANAQNWLKAWIRLPF